MTGTQNLDVLFCTQCFATDRDSSMGGVAAEHFCSNCGASNATVHISQANVNSIRSQASWVGKRYYPIDEDLAAAKERNRLIDLVPEFPGRKVTPSVTPGYYVVKQRTGKATRTSVIVAAGHPVQALQRAKYSLPYHSETYEDDSSD